MKLVPRIKQNIFFILLFLVSCAIFAVNVKMVIFSYNNFDFGKFDLGNMTQMLWNTLQGRLLYLTDYFGTNLPRWSMSHVDPILLLFVPVFYVFQHPLTLVFSQLILVIFSSLIIFKLAEFRLKSKPAGFLIGLSFLFYPAVGYLTAKTAFHGVTVVIPFFLLAFLVFEKMNAADLFPLKKMVIFWILLILTMAGKEQLPLYIFIYGLFIITFRNEEFFAKNEVKINKKWLNNFFSQRKTRIGLSIMIVSFIWFYTAFFVIIPKYSHLRIEGFEKFAADIGIDTEEARDVDLPNYFLSRYEAFGDSYGEIAFNVILNHKKAIKVFFGGDNIENLNRVFAPVFYIPVLYPQLLIIAAPDFMANYLTSAGGIGTGEIENHRISMIIPVLFISVIYAIGFLTEKLKDVLKYLNISFKNIEFIFPLILTISVFYTTSKFNNPVYLWIKQAFEKRVPQMISFAQVNVSNEEYDNLEIGEVVKTTQLEYKDTGCAVNVIKRIPDGASVSGPDYLGTHLAMRETYAIFPALYNTADYVIVDVFSQKILNILDLDKNINRDVVERIMKDENYKLDMGCGNLFVFKKVGPHNKTKLLPIQERYYFEEKLSYEILWGMTLVDYEIPEEFVRSEVTDVNLVYTLKDNKDFNGFVFFMTFINKDSGEQYQVANLPSFAILQPGSWKKDRYYTEDIEVALPDFLEAGNYNVFVGMDNKIKTRSIYLGDVQIK